MLVLSRRPGESIIIDKNIRLKVASGYRRDAGSVSLYVDQPGQIGRYWNIGLGENVAINDQVKIKALAMGSEVRLGITAPREMGIWREELLPLSSETLREVAR